MASNEELQSSNEELQSVNEELYTVNAENQEKIEILNRLNADLDSMAKAAAIATVFVDSDLRLTRFTPEATALFKIRDGDLGRPIDDFTNLLEFPDFIDELRRTTADGEMLQREISATNGRLYLARVLPYAVRENAPRGAVATFVDITTLRDAERLQAVLDSLPERVVVLDAKGRVMMINKAWRAYEKQRRASAKLSVGSDYLAVCGLDGNPDAALVERARSGLQKLLKEGNASFTLKYPCLQDQGGHRCVLHAAPIAHTLGGVIVSHIDLDDPPAWVSGDNG
jgi:two-component system CheB/CheR fusion protein